MDNIRQLRHDLRGRANSLMLCTSAIPLASDDRERLEFVDEVLLAADKVIAVLDRLEASADENGSAEPDVDQYDHAR